MDFCLVIKQASYLFFGVNIFASLGTRQRSRIQGSTAFFCERLVSYMCREKVYSCSSVTNDHETDDIAAINSFSYFHFTTTKIDQLLGTVVSVLKQMYRMSFTSRVIQVQFFTITHRMK